MNLIQCDKCGKKISVRGIRMEERWEDGMKIQSFSCTGCGKVYIGSIIDGHLREEILGMQGDRRRIQLMIQKKFHQKAVKKAEKRLETRRKKAIMYMEKLKAEYQEGNVHGEKEAGAGDSMGIQPGAGDENTAKNP